MKIIPYLQFPDDAGQLALDTWWVLRRILTDAMPNGVDHDEECRRCALLARLRDQEKVGNKADGFTLSNDEYNYLRPLALACHMPFVNEGICAIRAAIKEAKASAPASKEAT